MCITADKLAALEPIVQEPDVVVKKVCSLLEKLAWEMAICVISFKVLLLASTARPNRICIIPSVS